MIRILARSVIALSASLTLVLPSSGPAATTARASAAVSTKLEALSAEPISQGMPFRVRARVANHGALPVTVNLSFGLTGPDRGRPVSFYRDVELIPGRASISVGTSVVTSRYFAQSGRFQVAVAVGGKRVGLPLSFTVANASKVVPVFRDVTRAAGVVAELPPVEPSEWASGAAWADVNGDGFLDLFLPRRGRPALLWMGDRSGRFREEAAQRGVADVGRKPAGASFVDYDNDGHPDLFVFGDGGNHLYHNDGSGQFSDVTAGSGLEGGGNATSAAWGDYDGDGRLDVFVTNYGRVGPFGTTSFSYEMNRLYHNDGGGRFSDVTALLKGLKPGASFQGAWFDYNGDGRLDLYLANDFIGPNADRNHLWRNDGLGADGKQVFTDVSVSSRTAFRMNAMGIAIGDYNRDGRLDLGLSNIEPNRLLRNNGDGTFTDVGAESGIAPRGGHLAQPPITWGTAFYDFNLDGWEDLYFAGGYMENPVHIPNQLFVNAGDGRFLDLTAPSGADDPAPSRGVAFADYDRDGRVDLFVVNQAGTPRLLRNVTPVGGRHWLEVRAVGTASNRDGCGARLEATIPGALLVRQVSCGSTSLSSWSDTTVHFGLGTVDRVTELRIRWPSGTVQTLTDVKADRIITLTEPSRTTASHTTPAPVAASWRTWYLDSARQLRLEAPPAAASAETRRELRELLKLQRKRTPSIRRLVNKWQSEPAITVWTRVAFQMIRDFRPRPPAAARALALFETCLYDAMVAADDSRAAYPDARPSPSELDPRIDPLRLSERGSSYAPVEAAEAGAAETILPYLFPDAPRVTFQQLASEAVGSRLWAGLNYRSDVERARQLGRRVAELAIAHGESDGHANTGFAHPRPAGDGYWSSTPRGYEPPTGGPVGTWKPWLLPSPGALRKVIPGPSRYGTAALAAQTAKVLETRAKLTENQKEIAFFWDDGPRTLTPPGHWLDIAEGLLKTYKVDSRQTTRILALLAVTEYDAAIAVFEAKYFWWSIRPITVIWRLCDGGSTLCTEQELEADPKRATYRDHWFPIIPTPPFPSYPGGHATFSGAAGALLGYFFPRAARNLAGLAEQAANSRLYAGIHFDEDNRDGLKLGRAVAELAIRRAKLDGAPRIPVGG